MARKITRVEDAAPVAPVVEAPVAPVVEYVILVKATLRQPFWLSVPGADVRITVLSGLTVIMPVVETKPQPPERETV